MKKYIFSFLVLLLYYSSATAQRHQISISPEYNIPIGKLAWGNRAGVGIQLSYAHISGYKISRQAGFSISYTALPALADTLYYVVDKGGVGGVGIGTAVYSPFKMIQLKATTDFGLLLVKEKLYFNVGGGLGIIYGIRQIEFKDSFGAADGLNEIVGWGTLVPKASLEYKMGDHFSVSSFISYTFMIQLGNTNRKALKGSSRNSLLTMKRLDQLLSYESNF
jgi:hypothetical protein